MSARILIAEDDADLAETLRDSLSGEGYEVTVATDGRQALDAFRSTLRPDLLLLDLMLPRVTGFDVLRQLRDDGVATPIVVLSARADETDKVRCLDLGADDYLTKPAGFLELNARIRARLRRSAAVVLAFGPVEVDLGTREVRRAGATQVLTVREADMLRLLYEARGQVVTRRRFLEEVWHHRKAPSDTRTVDQFIKRLRQKLEDDPANPRHIVTVVGVGYRLDG